MSGKATVWKHSMTFIKQEYECSISLKFSTAVINMAASADRSKRIYICPMLLLLIINRYVKEMWTSYILSDIQQNCFISSSLYCRLRHVYSFYSFPVGTDTFKRVNIFILLNSFPEWADTFKGVLPL